ncbi:cytochrome-c oxidase [Planococcus koreensis]|uniref:cytochrome-c oxidase n=1 Tax=Planococcus koreensis TaxID=112331 RepID=UPI0039FD7178
MGVYFIKIASVFLLFGIVLGIYMGIAEDFKYGDLHAHINLVGWVTTGIYGLVYSFFPKIGSNKLAKTHFWLHIIGTPLLLGSIFLITINKMEAGMALGIPGALIVLLAVIIFGVNLFKNLNPTVHQNISAKV